MFACTLVAGISGFVMLYPVWRVLYLIQKKAADRNFVTRLNIIVIQLKLVQALMCIIEKHETAVRTASITDFGSDKVLGLTRALGVTITEYVGNACVYSLSYSTSRGAETKTYQCSDSGKSEKTYDSDTLRNFQAYQYRMDRI